MSNISKILTEKEEIVLAYLNSLRNERDKITEFRKCLVPIRVSIVYSLLSIYLVLSVTPLDVTRGEAFVLFLSSVVLIFHVIAYFNRDVAISSKNLNAPLSLVYNAPAFVYSMSNYFSGV